MELTVFIIWLSTMIVILFIPLIMLKKKNPMTWRDLLFVFVGIAISSVFEILLLL